MSKPVCDNILTSGILSCMVSWLKCNAGTPYFVLAWRIMRTVFSLSMGSYLNTTAQCTSVTQICPEGKIMPGSWLALSQYDIDRPKFCLRKPIKHQLTASVSGASHSCPAHNLYSTLNGSASPTLLGLSANGLGSARLPCGWQPLSVFL